MLKKSYTENIKKIHDEYLRDYPSFIKERASNEQLHAENSSRFINQEPTSSKRSTSEQTLKHTGPRCTSNGRASKALPQ
jgi:hypothetical protein